MAFWIGLLFVFILYFSAGAFCIWQGFDKALKVVENCYWALLGLWWVIYGLFFTNGEASLRLYVLCGYGFALVSVILLVRAWLKTRKEQ